MTAKKKRPIQRDFRVVTVCYIKIEKKVVEGYYHLCNYIFAIGTPNCVEFGRGYLLG